MYYEQGIISLFFVKKWNDIKEGLMNNKKKRV